MLERLADPALYRAAFNLIVAKERERQSDEAALSGAPPLSALVHDMDALSRRLSLLVSSWRYELSPVVPRRATIEGKSRVLFHSPPLDVVVMTALAAVLRPMLEHSLSPRVFSYREGRSSMEALMQLSAFMKEHRALHPDPRTRGLYVLRRDIHAYGDRIPAGPGSSLWEGLKRALAVGNAPVDDKGWRWVQGAIRPPLAKHEAIGLDPAVGIPTGSPLQPLMGNLYLTPLDCRCEVIPGGFYARYGDDILFAHASGEVVEATSSLMDHTLSELELQWSRDKCSNLYLTAAGRAGTLPAYAPTTELTYLGARVDARGETGLSSDKRTRLLRQVARRLEDTQRICANDTHQSRAEAYCGVVNASLDPEHPVADRTAQFLRHGVTDRGQLKELDYQIALRVAETLTGVRGVRAFRKAPMRWLKQRCGLRSLVVERNRVERARGMRG